MLIFFVLQCNFSSCGNSPASEDDVVVIDEGLISARNVADTRNMHRTTCAKPDNFTRRRFNDMFKKK